MNKLSISIILFLCFISPASYANISLSAKSDAANSQVIIQWNMINYPANTAYALYKSEDGVVWNVAAANPALRNYNSSTILAYRDNFADQQKLYYRVKVYDANENIVEISNTAMVDNPKIHSHTKSHAVHLNALAENNEAMPADASLWHIVPNPVRDMLTIFYADDRSLKGVINITVRDGTGKVVIRFRAASNNKQLHVPVSNLRRGVYFIKINVNEMEVNNKFLKE